MNHPMLSILIPAAGASTRLGQSKQLVVNNGKTLIQNTVDLAQSLDPREIIVVTGANAQAVESAIQNIPVRFLHNPNWSTGLGGSIALGAAAISPDSTGLMILLCDQWRIQIQDLKTLTETWKSALDRIVCANAEDVNMPPVIFPSTCFKQLKALEGDRGARTVLDANSHLLCSIQMTNAASDLDTRTQLKNLRP